MRALFLSFFFALSLAAQPVTVAVAANVSYAVNDLVQAYEKHYPNDNVRVILGSSGKLTAQIRHGAPYDLFLSADTAFPESLYDKGVGLAPPKVYAKGVLALFSRTPRDLSKGLETLLSPDIRRIALANPKTAPYGKAAMEALKKAHLYQTLRPRFIYGESVSQTLAYALKAADAGLVAKSALFSPQLYRFQKGRHWVEVDPSLYAPIAQGALLLTPMGRDFYEFLFGPEARAIFQHYGYRLP